MLSRCDEIKLIYQTVNFSQLFHCLMIRPTNSSCVISVCQFAGRFVINFDLLDIRIFILYFLLYTLAHHLNQTLYAKLNP